MPLTCFVIKHMIIGQKTGFCLGWSPNILMGLEVVDFSYSIMLITVSMWSPWLGRFLNMLEALPFMLAIEPKMVIRNSTTLPM